jgi:SAM-dependent methyltransferase
MTDVGSLRRLLTPQGREALDAAMAREPGEADFLDAFQVLARRFPKDVARAAVEQAVLRRKAALKFPSAEHMFFTRIALEQSTAEAVARYRAQRFAGSSLIFDLGCGFGGDSLALARMAPVVAVDYDHVRLMLLNANASALGIDANVTPLLADINFPAWRIPPGAAAFFDPERRVQGRRLRRIASYRPSLDSVLAMLPALDGLGVKVGPAVDRGEIADLGCEVEFISLKGELKEATLWFAAFRTTSWRATLLPGPHTLTPGDEGEVMVCAPADYLYEPDPAVLRAGLVRTLAHQLQAAQIDKTIAYLTSNQLVSTPFARAFRVREVLPFGLKRLKRRLREMGVGRVTIKKRGSPVDVPDFERRLKLRGEEKAIVVLTRTQSEPIMIIVEEPG